MVSWTVSIGLLLQIDFCFKFITRFNKLYWILKFLSKRRNSKILCVLDLSYNVLPSEVKKAINCDSNTFDKNDLVITIKHTGPQIPISFHAVFCDYCQTNTLPKFLDKYKDNLGELSNLSNLIVNWDILEIPNQFCDVIKIKWQVQIHYVSLRNQLIMLIEHIHSLLSLKAAKLWKRKKYTFKINFFKQNYCYWYIVKSNYLESDYHCWESDYHHHWFFYEIWTEFVWAL